MTFITRGLSGVSIGTNSLTFLRDQIKAPCTVSTSMPFQAPGRHAFEVSMPQKEARTAIGLSADPMATYLTPSYSKQTKRYVSMGGAGFMYPSSRASGARYGEGDMVRVEIDFDCAPPSVTFLVNGAQAAVVAWEHGSSAYPCISSEGGTVICEFRFDHFGSQQPTTSS